MPASVYEISMERNRHGGGVVIYIPNNLVYINGNDIIPDILEVQVKKPRMKPLLVCSWYRAPDLCVEILDHFEIFLQNIEHENKDVILTGGLNCNLLSTETNKKREILGLNVQLSTKTTYNYTKENN